MLYTPTIGLEIHAELKTKTKMFCDSKNDPDEKHPNVNVCPVCMGHPGTLPTINKEAVRHILKIGMTVGGRIADIARFDRKNYFYPDLPKGYQISQYDNPLVSLGEIAGVALERVHLEEDTGRSSHEGGDYSLVDFNRAGIPLMELVTKPVIKDAATAVFFAKELQLLLRYLDASDANMEKGEMRVEANISVSKDDKKGTKVEVKNLNSFKAVEKAIAYEISRQAEVLERGERVIQETRGWDENKGKTFSQRIKEESHDYRYFPDPDLPTIKISDIPEFAQKVLEKEIPETPWKRRERLHKEFGLPKDTVSIFVNDARLGSFFEEVCRFLDNDREAIKLAANYITSDLINLVNESSEQDFKESITAESFSELITMLKEGKIFSRGAKDILEHIFKQGGRPFDIAKEKSLLQKSDKNELNMIIQKVIKENPVVVKEYKAGKEKSLQFLIGQAMKETKGSANPQVLSELLKEKLKN